MNSCSIIMATKVGSPESRDLAAKVRAWLEKRNCSVFMVEHPYEIPLEEMQECQPDLVIVLGGDGTILSVVRSMLDQGAPFVGVNLGKVGFLAEISPTIWQEQLSRIFRSAFRVSRRLVLGYRIVRQEGESISGVAINELVISRGELARLISLDLESSQGTLQCIRADGLIFSTPTGSTAYCISAGGPLVHPEMQGIVLTPVCVFLHDFKPLVMPASESFLVRVCPDSPEAYVTVDGQTGYVLNAGDVLMVSRHARDLKLLMCEEQGFIAKLSAKRFFVRG